jgi:hypothetical protein
MSADDVVPPGAGQSWRDCLDLLSLARRTRIPPVVAGFDGFVDTIVHAVSERHSATEYTRVPTLRAFSEKILAAAGGRNMNIEMVPKLTKIGGNGPILANALAHFGVPVTYIGCLGLPELHPVFTEFSQKITTFSIAEPGYSDAIEFNDGKLICGKQQAVSEVTWQSVLEQLPIEQLVDLVRPAGLIAFLNWGIVFSMTDMMNEFLHHIGPHVSDRRLPFFIDTADPSKRSETDTRRFVETLPRLAAKFNVYLGFNLRESAFIARAVGLSARSDRIPDVLTYTGELRDRLGVDALIIHWSRNAVACDTNSAVSVEAEHTENPQISTGAGDHFNAGFCLGLLLGGGLLVNLRLGVATSGFYVRKARSPSVEDLISFIKTLSAVS